MRIPFLRKKSSENVGNNIIFIPGIGKILTDRTHNFIIAQKLSDIVYSCITLIQAAAKMVPWYVYKRQGEESIEISDGTLVNFLRRPGKRLSWSRFIDTYYAHLLLTGDVYIYPMLPEYKTRIETRFLRPDRTIPKKINGDEIVYEYNGGLQTYQESEIIHISLVNPEADEVNELRGLSPIAPIAKNIDIANYSKEWLFRLLENGAQPPIALSSEGPLTQDQREFLKEQLKKEFLGPENAMNPLILEGMKPQRIGFSPKDLEYDPIMKAMLRRVSNIFHVPAELLGDVEYKTYSNAKEAVKALYYWAVLPHLTSLRDELNWQLVPMIDGTGSVYLDYDTSGVEALAVDLAELWERVGRSVDRGILNRQEARDELNYGASDEPGAEKLTVSANTIPLEAVTGSNEAEE